MFHSFGFTRTKVLNAGDLKVNRLRLTARQNLRQDKRAGAPLRAHINAKAPFLTDN
jgi:hypothetical protein